MGPKQGRGREEKSLLGFPVGMSTAKVLRFVCVSYV
jgi:hypothetical protein